MRRCPLLVCAGVWLALAVLPPAPAPEPRLLPAQAEFFEKSVRPVLATHCLECHGSRKQKGGLRLDSRTSVLAGGDSGPAIVPGKPEKSLLITAVHYDDESPRMPPKG